jgi:hypothetical protein
VNDGINLIISENSLNLRLVTDITFYKLMPFWKGQILQVLQAASIGKQVQVDNESIRLGSQNVADKVRAYEAGTASDKNMAEHYS